MLDIADDLSKQLEKSCGRLVYKSLALGKSADTKDTAQLVAIISGVNENFEVVRGLAKSCSVQRWTAEEERSKEIKDVVEKLQLMWGKLAGALTDDASAMVRKRNGADRKEA